MDSTQSRDRQHGNDGFGDLRHIDNDSVAFSDAEACQHVGCFFDLCGQLRISDFALVTGFPLKKQSNAVTSAFEDVAVETVVGDVDATVRKPSGKRRVRPVEYLGEGLVPVKKLSRLICPEA